MSSTLLAGLVVAGGAAVAAPLRYVTGLAGATVLRGMEGFGASSRIHTSRLLSLSEDLPLAIVIVDAADKIESFLPQLDEVVTEGLVIIDPVQVIKYVGRARGRAAT